MSTMDLNPGAKDHPARRRAREDYKDKGEKDNPYDILSSPSNKLAYDDEWKLLEKHFSS